MNIKNIAIIGIPTLGLLIALTFWWQQHTPPMPVAILPLAAPCQLHEQTCQVEHQGASISLEAQTKPIPIAKGIEFIATIEHLPVQRVQLDINGSNMYMGYNRIDLKQQDATHWQGKSLLAFCTIDAMQWQLTLIIDTSDGQQWQVPFPLTTPYNAPH